jgi:microcystin-dependent protein
LPVPSGAVIAYAGPTTTIPSGWLICDGSAVSRTTYANLFAAVGTAWGNGNGSTTFNVPDMRGMFLRGVDSRTTGQNDPDNTARTAQTTGGNSGANVGSVQQDQFESHHHPSNSSNASLGLGSPVLTAGSGASNTGNTGGNETRPKNVFVFYIIKN